MVYHIYFSGKIMKSDPVDWYAAHGENNFPILCPFHQEETPSCIIMPKKGAFHCIGCGAQGVIEQGEILVTVDQI
jgi:hypothetical protein